MYYFTGFIATTYLTQYRYLPNHKFYTPNNSLNQSLPFIQWTKAGKNKQVPKMNSQHLNDSEWGTTEYHRH